MLLPRPAIVYQRLHSWEATYQSHYQGLQVNYYKCLCDITKSRNICTHANLSINFCNDLRDVQQRLNPEGTVLMLKWGWIIFNCLLIFSKAGHCDSLELHLPHVWTVPWHQRGFVGDAEQSGLQGPPQKLEQDQGSGLAAYGKRSYSFKGWILSHNKDIQRILNKTKAIE